VYHDEEGLLMAVGHGHSVLVFGPDFLFIGYDRSLMQGHPSE